MDIREVPRDDSGKFHRPNRFKVWLRGSKKTASFNILPYLDPGYPQLGPDEASEGIYSGRGHGGSRKPADDPLLKGEAKQATLDKPPRAGI